MMLRHRHYYIGHTPAAPFLGLYNRRVYTATTPLLQQNVPPITTLVTLIATQGNAAV